MSPNHFACCRGAAKTEYVIVVVLIAIAVLVAVARYGATLQNEYVASDAEIEVEIQP